MIKYLLVFFVLLGSIFASGSELDIVTFKNGSVLKGIITTRDSRDNLTIILPGGASVECKGENIESITKVDEISRMGEAANSGSNIPINHDKPPVWRDPVFDENLILEADYNPPYNQKDPVAAFALSFLLAGLGQHYNGESGKGLLFHAATLIGYLLILSPKYDDNLGLVFMLGSGIGSMIDAPISALRINRSHGFQSDFSIGSNKFALNLRPEFKGASLKLSYNF